MTTRKTKDSQANITARLHSQANREVLNTLRYENTEQWDQIWRENRERLVSEGFTETRLDSAMRSAMQREYRTRYAERWTKMRKEIVDALKVEAGWVDQRGAANARRRKQ